jgi:Na+/melibiose symporter-like transporter
MFLASLLVDYFISVAGASKALPMLWLITLFIAALDLLCLLKVHEHPYVTSSYDKLSARTLLGLIREYPEYMKIVAVVCVMSFASSISSQYYVTFLLDDVGVSYTFINSVNLINVATMLLFTKPWKKLLDANTFRKNLFLTYLLFSPHVIGLFFVSGSRLFLYPLTMVYASSISVGLSICNLMFPYINLPERNRTVFLALFNTTLALATFPGILTGRILFGVFSNINISSSHPSQLLVLVWGATLAASAFLARWLMKEKRSKSV